MSEQPTAGPSRIELQIESKKFNVAPGSSVTIPLKIIFNGGEAETFQLSLLGVPSDWIYIPQPVKQFIPGDKKDVTVSIHPPAPPESRAGNYRLEFELSSLGEPGYKAALDCQLTVAAYEIQGETGVLVESTQYSVPPGKSGVIRLLLSNNSPSRETFEASLTGIPGEWVSTSTPIKTLGDGEQGELLFNVQPPPLPKGRVGRYPIVIRLFGQSAPDKIIEIGATLTVAAYENKGRIGVLMEATQFAVNPGTQIAIPIVLLNQGLTEDSFKLAVSGIPVNWVSTASPVTRLLPGEQKEITLLVQPPRHAKSKAGRNAFKISIISQNSPEQTAEVECILTVGVYSLFSSELRPPQIEAGHTAQVVVENKGNIQGTFNIKWSSEDLQFEPAEVQEIAVAAGEIGAAEFQAAPLRRQLIGGESEYPYAVQVRSKDGGGETLSGKVNAHAWVPVWVIPVVLVFCLAVACLTTYLLLQRQTDVSEAEQAIQTASANQTAAAIIGEEDTDGDGLTNREEAEIGTDPDNPDTDADLLQDGPEVKVYITNPLYPDTDGDVLSDGDEVGRGTDPLRPDSDTDQLNDGDEVQRGTDPLIPDSDQDGLGDGDEVQRSTDPLKPDTDEDKLYDGPEVQNGTNPLDPDTDKDKLMDGDETPPCPDPLNPDTDGDSIIDGEDPDPCDPANPSITASAIPPTETPLPPTVPPTASPTGEPTEPVVNIGRGTIVFESNRDGNAEIYLIGTQSFEVIRLTNDPGVDTQPSWSPDGNQIAFASNRSGNFEIYIMNNDGSDIRNITNTELADDLHPSWSPDGNWIVFSTNRDGDQEVYTIQIDGPGIHNLSNAPGVQDYQPHWFESGGILFGSDLIVFTSERDGNPEIYRMNSDGSELARLTENPSADNSPAGSPDGNQIVFVSERDGNPEVYVMDVDGGNPQNRTNNPAADNYPAWRANGEWIAFSSKRDTNQEIYVMTRDGSSLFNVTQNPSEDLFPSWK